MKELSVSNINKSVERLNTLQKPKTRKELESYVHGYVIGISGVFEEEVNIPKDVKQWMEYYFLEAFYFTFGSSEDFPYQNAYLIVMSENLETAIDTFNRNYPPRREEEKTINCSFYYKQEEWDAVKKNGFFTMQAPVEIIL